MKILDKSSLNLTNLIFLVLIDNSFLNKSNHKLKKRTKKLNKNSKILLGNSMRRILQLIVFRNTFKKMTSQRKRHSNLVTTARGLGSSYNKASDILFNINIHDLKTEDTHYSL